jgi:geranylgeranyl diphosphate synthase type II
VFKLDAYIEDKQRVINAHLDRFLDRGTPYPTALNEAMRYSIEAGGKRLRPLLCLAACEAVGGKEADCLASACALEFIHTYSLVHDDLPAMDDDDTRRGKPTCHKAFGEATAILAGDALLTAAFEILGHEVAETAAPAAAAKVIAIVAKAAGASGMVQGQMLDLLFEKKAVSWKELSMMHGLKTGALIEASVKVGAVMGGGTDEQIDALTVYGSHVGLAFQVADDLLNERGDPELLGKPVGSDKAMSKATAVSTLGLDGATMEAMRLLRKGLEGLAVFGNRAEALIALGKYVVERRH